MPRLKWGSFTSGTTKSISFFIRHWLELSITIAPACSKIGANCLLVPPPALIKT